MKTIKIVVFVGLFIISTLYISVFSSTTTGAVKGYVRDIQTQNPISKAKITLVSAQSEAIKYKLFSDKKGNFYNGGLIPGLYNITVEKDGYLPMAGSIRVRLGDTSKVEIKLESLKSLDLQSVKFSNHGLALLNAGKYEEAIKKFTEAIQQDQSNPLLYYYRAMSLEKNGNIDKAIEDYRKSNELKSDFILPISRIGKIYAKKGDFEKAIEFYKKAVNLGDQDTTTHYNLGVCLLNLRNNIEARSVFENLISLDANYSDAYYQLGIIYIGLQDVKKAKEFLEKFIEIDPENKNVSIAKQILKGLN